MTLKTKGLVLKVSGSRESDRVITVLTPDLGLIRAYAKGAKNIKNKKFAATGLFCYSDFLFYEGKDLYIVDEATENEIFFELRNDIESMALAQYFAEIILSVTPEGIETEDILRLTLNSLHFLCEHSKPIELIKSVFELKLMCFLGFMPDILACCNCGETNGLMYFDVLNSTLYCSSCKSRSAGVTVPVNESMLAVLRHIVFSDFSKLFSFSASDDTLSQVSSVCEKYIQYKTEKKYKTLDFYKSVRI